MLIEYIKCQEDVGWIVKGASNGDGFGLAVGSGSVMWSVGSRGKEEEFQLRGKIQLEENRGHFRVVLHGTEVDNGPMHLVKIFLPSDVVWKKSEKALISKNTPFVGTGYIVTFATPNSCENMSRIQFVCSSEHDILARALRCAVKEHNNLVWKLSGR